MKHLYRHQLNPGTWDIWDVIEIHLLKLNHLRWFCYSAHTAELEHCAEPAQEGFKWCSRQSLAGQCASELNCIMFSSWTKISPWALGGSFNAKPDTKIVLHTATEAEVYYSWGIGAHHEEKWILSSQETIRASDGQEEEHWWWIIIVLQWKSTFWAMPSTCVCVCLAWHHVDTSWI